MLYSYPMILRYIKRFFLVIIFIIIIIPVLLYLPPLQKWAFDKGIEMASKSTGWDITAEKLDLSFPLRLTVENLLVDDKGDTTIYVSSFYARLNPLSLLKLHAHADYATASGLKYNMMTQDSAMTLRANVNDFMLNGLDFDFRHMQVDIGRAGVVGGDVNIYFNPDIVTEKEENDSTSMALVVNADLITIDSLNYSMQMLPTIDTLDVSVLHAELHKGYVNIGTCRVDAKYLLVDGVDATYLLPTAEYIAEHPVKEVADSLDVTPDSLLWTIRGDKVELRNAAGLYAVNGAKPAKGLDFNYIQGDSLGFIIENLYNKGTEIRIPLKHIQGRERSGLIIASGKGLFAMDSTKMQVGNFIISTPASALRLDALIGNGVFEQKPQSQLSVDAQLSLAVSDVECAFPEYSSYLNRLGGDNSINLRADVAGPLSDLTVDTIGLSIPGVTNLLLRGNINYPTDAKKRAANFTLDGNTWNLNRFKSLFLDKTSASQFNLIATSIRGKINMRGDTYGTNMRIAAGGGAAVLAGTVNLVNEAYKVNIDATRLPIDKVMPKSSFGTLTANAKAEGRGFNPLLPTAGMDADIDLVSFGYNGYEFKDILANAKIKDGMADLNITSTDEPLDFTLNAHSTLPDNRYEFNADMDISNINLLAINMATDTLWLKGKLYADGVIDLNNPIYSINLKLKELESQLGIKTLKSNEANLTFKSDSITTLNFSERDLKLSAQSNCRLDTLLSKLTDAGELVNRQIANKEINFEELNNSLPEFGIHASMGRNNILNEYLKQDKMSIYNAQLNIQRTDAISMDMNINRLVFSGITLDTITMSGTQEGTDMLYNLIVKNKPGNLDQFAYTDLHGKLGSNAANVILNQQNRKGDYGFKFGIAAEYEKDDEIKVSIFPEDPIIGYRKWTINKDNFIEYRPATQHIDANVDLRSDAGYISLMTQHVNDSVQENIVLKAVGVNLAEWLNVSPFMPKIGGMLNADASLRRDRSGLEGQGSLGLSDLMYNKKDLGTIDFNVDLSTDSAGNNIATAGVDIGGRKAIKVSGILGATNDSVAGSVNYNLTIDSLPLAIANPFIPQGIVELSGYLSGEATMRGPKDAPVLNGTLHCDTTSLKLPMFGSRLAFGNEHIDMRNNNVIFDNFNIIGINNNPISVNGNVDLSTMSNPMINLSMEGENVQIVDSKYTSRSQVFGKAFINLNASANGHLSQLNTRAFLDILPKTNVTYVLQEDMSTLSQNKDTEMVKFVNFSDTTEVDADEDAQESFNLDLNAILNVQQGSILNVNLSPDGKNKVQLSGAGTLTYNMSAGGDGRLSGRYTINNGFVRYYPPFISEKYFTFTPGSYVAFNGDMMNPTLSITATGNQATTVLSEGSNPMRVNFQITASVTNTLNDMKVDFDLAAPNNGYIETELQSVSPAQRSAQAINLMLYGTYSSGQTSSATATNANMLYSLLSSQLNNLASKMVKGVDISFGINQYNTSNNGSSGTGMNYSYSVSKSLFDDRFKMTVGGNYDTNESSDISVAQSLFSNISFEYLLNQSGTMSLQLYNKVTDNNIYQTQVNETGLAFTLRRKISNLMDVFRSVKTGIFKLKGSSRKATTNKTEMQDEAEVSK